MAPSADYVDRGDGILVPVEQVRQELDDQEPALVDALRQMHEQPLNLNFTWSSWQAYLVFCSLQLSTTHPELGDPIRQTMEAIARNVQHGLATAYPQIATMLEAGWHREFDAGAADGD